MLKYSTTKGAYGKGHHQSDFGGGHVNLSTSMGQCGGHANISNCNGQSANSVKIDRNVVGACSPSKLPSFASSSSNGNQISLKLNSSMDQTCLGSSTKTPFPVPTNNNILGIIKIYTDWANHYLEKSQKKRLIQDLQKDMQDSLLLIDVIESVVCEKVPNVKRKPKNTAQVVENIGYCLQYLSTLGVSLDGIVAKDIRDGQLKSILGLFFSLSRYKQQQKSLSKLQNGSSSLPQTIAAATAATPASEMLSKLPSPFRNTASANASSSANNCSPSHLPNATNSNNNNNNGRQIACSLNSSNGSEQATSTNQLSKSNCESSTTGNKIKTISNSKDGTTINKPTTTAVLSTSGKVLGLKPPSAVKVPTSNSSKNNPTSTIIVQQNQTTSNVPASNLPTPKDAKMLDKLKLFGSKDKSSSASDKNNGSSSSASANGCSTSNNSPRLPKSSTRASNSSSGFSSAKSELSEVSSFADQQSPSGYSSSKLVPTSSSPKLAVKSTNKKNLTKSSPKPSKKSFKPSSEQSNEKSASGSAQTSPQLMKKQKLPLYDSTSAKPSTNMDNDFNPQKSLPPTSKLKPVTSPTCSQIPGLGKGCIPKPTLAVKGMKPVSSNKQLNECPNDTGVQQQIASSSQSYHTDQNLSSQLKHSNSSMEQITVVNEREKFLQNYKAQRSYSSAMMKTSTPSSPVTVGVVSPITHHKKLPLSANNSTNVSGGGRTSSNDAVPIIGALDLNSSLDSQGGHQSDSNSSHTSGNQSDTASVIYCPSADEKECASSGVSSNNNLRRNKSKSPASSSLSDDSSMQKLRELSSSPARTQSRLETTFDSSTDGVVTQTVSLDDEPPGLTGAEEEVSNSIQPMQPLIPRASPYAFLRGIGNLSGKGPSTVCQPLEPSSVAVARNCRSKSPRLLLNKPLASLLHADGREENNTDVGCGGGVGMNVVVEPTSNTPVKCAAGEVSAGYVSEGDVLQLSDQIDLDISGYMSEGGISLYARKLQARFREGLELAVRDSMRKATDIIDDSFEDSSSLSSGISETIDEISTDDLTGSSLSDQAINPYGSLKRNLYHNGKLLNGVRKAESGQQTERPTYATLNGGSCGNRQQQQQQRKLSDQYDPQRIDSLLQKCRTSTRGLNAISQRPKSEQMNGSTNGVGFSISNQRTNGRYADNPDIELSADGQTLNVSSTSNYSFRRVPPLAMNSLHVLKRGDQQNGSSSDMGAIGRSSAGYHSLDRKKHLLAHNGGDHLKYCSDSDALYVNYPPPRSNAGAALAMVSPRHVASLKKGTISLPVSHEGPLPHEDKDMTEAWARHVGGQPSMSRSMIEPEMKMSIVQERTTSNGHARLSIPPQNLSLAAALQQATNGILQGTNMQCRSPRINHRISTQSESGMVRKDNSDGSPSSQLYLHKLMSNVSSGTIYESNHPSSPGSMSAPATSRLPNHGHSHSYNNSPYLGNVLDKVGALEEVHGSSLSLASSSSSVYSTAEEKYQSEIRKLHRDLESYKDKVQTLTTQQSTYAHVVAAFEQSLQSMTKRVQSLTVASEQKDCELTDLKTKINVLREMSVSRGLNFDELLLSPNLQRRHTFNTNEPPGLVRQLSSDSMTSVVSQRSSMSGSSKNSKALSVCSAPDKKGKKSWAHNLEMPNWPLRSSFTKAFGKAKKNKNGSMSDVEENQLNSDTSNPASPMHTPRNSAQLRPAGSSSALNETDGDPNVHRLKMQLIDKDTVLTDVRLDALTAAHRVDELQDLVTKMKMKMSNLEMDNQRLQSLVTHSSRAPSQSSLPLMSDDNESVSEGGNVLSDMSVPISVDATMGDNRDGYRVTLTVNFNLAGNIVENSSSYVLIGSLCLSHKTKWDLLDTIVSKLFKEYVLRIDQVSNLGLSAESILGYNVGGVNRLVLEPVPQALPCSFLNENINNIVRVLLRGSNQAAVDSLAFETLIPKTIIQRYISLLFEHRRIIISGFSGTGKTYLAQKLAEYIVVKNGKRVDASSIVMFNIENHAVSSELKRYLSRLSENIQNPRSTTNEPPCVIVLDNLQKVLSLGDMFASLLNIPVTSCPYIIGTTTQQPSSTTTNLQLHHNFRWVTCANHMEPVKGLLTRYLRRRQIEGEIQRGSRYPMEIVKVLDWLPKVWSQLNKFLETVNSPDVTIGPRLFLSCPMEADEARDWFVCLWNETILPYLIVAVKDGLQIDSHRSNCEDPTEFVIQTWPWVDGEMPDSLLQRIRFDDGDGSSYENIGKSFMSDTEADPLVMLMRLQEQAKKQRQKEMNFIGLRQNGVESTL